MVSGRGAESDPRLPRTSAAGPGRGICARNWGVLIWLHAVTAAGELMGEAGARVVLVDSVQISSGQFIASRRLRLVWVFRLVMC